MLLLVLLALPIGLLSPVLGASAGFGVGIALVLRQPDVPGVMKRRLWATFFSVAYTLFLLVVVTPAGVFTGAVLPPILVGLADEYSVWRYQRQTAQ
jgi:hypothetical protein